MTAEEFQLAGARVIAKKEPRKKGHRPEIVGYEIICSLPLDTAFSKAEKRFFVRRMCKAIGAEDAVWAWHIRKNGRWDFHYVAVNWNGQTVLEKYRSPSVRWVAAAAALAARNAINLYRQKRGEKTVTTLMDMARKKAQEHNFELLSELVVRRAREEDVTKWEDVKKRLKHWIEEAGNQITRFNANFIAVLHPKSRKSKRYKLASLAAVVVPAIEMIPISIPHKSSKSKEQEYS